MRHLKVGKKLGRTASHRKATLRSLSASLIKHHRIVTTLVKAKELRRFVEPVLTKAKEDTSHHRQQVFAFLQDKEAVTHLFEEVGPLVADRPGGYTRVIKLGPRDGDGAEMAMIELVDYNDVKPEGGKSTRKRTRRSGRSRKKKSTQTQKPAEQKKKTEEAEQAAAEPQTEERAEKKGKAKASEVKEEESAAAKVETESKPAPSEKEKSDSKAKAETKEAESKVEDKTKDKQEDSEEKGSSDKK